MKSIYNTLLSTIGLSFKDGRLFDEDNMALLLFKNKYIAENEANIMRNNSILFDPKTNRALSQYLFQVYIEKETQEGNVYLTSYAIVPEKVTKDRSEMVRRKLQMILGNGAHVETKYYYNESLAYIEAIFLASGMVPVMIPDLIQYDNIEDVIKK